MSDSVDAELVKVIQCWPSLPPALKQAVLAIVASVAPAPSVSQSKLQPGDDLEGPHEAYGR